MLATPTAAPLRNLEPRAWGLGDGAARPLRALGAVLGDLADLRYDAQWVGLPASLVGAPHHRYRIFITAHRQDAVSDPARLGCLPRRGDTRPGPSATGHDRPEPSSHRPHPSWTGWLTDQLERTGDAVRTDRGDLHRWERYADTIAR